MLCKLKFHPALSLDLMNENMQSAIFYGTSQARYIRFPIHFLLATEAPYAGGNYLPLVNQTIYQYQAGFQLAQK